MRRFGSYALLAGAGLFFLWEVYAAVHWVRQAGGVGAAPGHFWNAVRADWMALIVVSDHLVIAGVVLLALWIDAARRGWTHGRRCALAAAFVALGTPTLLAYLAWRLLAHRPE
jgi:hypothetical protein